jgi:hypothetical protein
VLCRLAAARTPEILLGYAILATGVLVGLRRWWLRATGLAVLAGGLAASLAFPAYHFVLLAHLHNVVPLVFLWEWSRGLAPGRGAFLAVQLLWVLAIPALILAGVFDPWIAGGTSDVAGFAGSPAAIAAPVTPPAVVVGLRFLVVFAYLQTMHYVVWVGFLPRFAPDAACGFELRVPWLRGWRPWALGIGVAMALAVLFVVDYAQGRLLYSSFASYHAYLEFPVLLAVLFGRRAAGRHRARRSQNRRCRVGRWGDRPGHWAGSPHVASPIRAPTPRRPAVLRLVFPARRPTGGDARRGPRPGRPRGHAHRRREVGDLPGTRHADQGTDAGHLAAARAATGPGGLTGGACRPAVAGGTHQLGRDAEPAGRGAGPAA